MIRSGLINMIREKAQKGKSAYAIGKCQVIGGNLFIFLYSKDM